MNIFGVILFVSLMLFMTLTGLYIIIKHSKTGTGNNVLAWGLITSSVLMLLFLINGFVYRIPNQFELGGAVMSTDRAPPRNVTITNMPNTNADPSAAYTHERELLDKAKEQQQDR